MKHGKRLTLGMKKFLKDIGLNPDNWLYTKNTPYEIHFVHIHSLKPKVIKKEGPRLCL
jgi:hypothetical protein